MDGTSRCDAGAYGDCLNEVLRVAQAGWIWLVLEVLLAEPWTQALSARLNRHLFDRNNSHGANGPTLRGN